MSDEDPPIVQVVPPKKRTPAQWFGWVPRMILGYGFVMIILAVGSIDL